MNGNDPNNPYPQYPPPGQAPVHGQAAPHPETAAPPPAGPPGWSIGPNGQWVQDAPPQAAPPQAAPPQAGYPQGPPPVGGQPWEQSTAGFDQLPADVRAELEAEMQHTGNVNFSDIEYFVPKKPTSIGQTVGSVVRLLPGWAGPQSRYWHKEWRHFCTVTLDDGRAMRLPRICPAQNVVAGQPVQPCPICERYERAQAAGDKQTAAALKARSRFYLNVIDAEDQQSHHKTNAEGQPVLRSKVWGLSSGLFRKIGNIIGARGPIYDMQVGRYIKIWTTKTGSDEKDVRYDVIDASDACPVEPGFEGIELMPLDQLDVVKDYAALSREIASTYPDAAGAQVAPPAAAAAPYANPYQAQPGPPQGWQAAPPAAAAPPQTPPQHAAPPQGWQPPVPAAAPQAAAQPPQQGWQPPPAAAAPQAAPPVAPAAAPPQPGAAPPGWAWVNGQWVPAPQAVPPTGYPPPQGSGGAVPF